MSVLGALSHVVDCVCLKVIVFTLAREARGQEVVAKVCRAWPSCGGGSGQTMSDPGNKGRPAVRGPGACPGSDLPAGNRHR